MSSLFPVALDPSQTEAFSKIGPGIVRGQRGVKIPPPCPISVSLRAQLTFHCTNNTQHGLSSYHVLGRVLGTLYVFTQLTPQTCYGVGALLSTI
jgi:hypothetical protein